MGKKALFLCGLLVCLGASAWPAGRKEANESHEVEDPSGFSRSIDINEKKPGKYNYYLEAKDKSGNATLAGPDNMYIDPPSDLPRATAINPIPNMRVQGNLNIVGVATDDDGVVGVELTVTRGRDGKGEELVSAFADGTDKWSYFLNTTDPEIWTDGVYAVTSWATDINLLSGVSEDFPEKVRRRHTVYWNLDRKKPETLVTSHEIGALVSGNVKIKGTVYDGNLIEYLRYSTDGDRYIPVKISYDKTNNIYNWAVDIDTKKLEDGPALVSFQAKDKMGSVGNAAHLFFVNNTPPDVEIVYPLPDAVVNGVFSIAGFARHGVGLSSVSWKAGKLGGEFDYLPGNHWWTADVDLRGQKITAIEIEIRAVDVSGNTTVKKQKYKVDQNADLPTVTLSEPALTGVTLRDGYLAVKGAVRDDDGAASIFYSFAGQAEPVEIPCSENFQFLISDFPEGTHTMEIWAKDITGVTGPKVQVKNIQVPGELPQPRIASVTAGLGSAARTEQFHTGMTVRLDPKARTAMEITVRAPALSGATIAFGDLPAVSFKPAGGKDGLLRASVPVPATLRTGFTKIELTAADRFGREAAFNEYVFINQTDPAVLAGDDSGRWFEWVRPNEAGGRIVLESEDEVLIGLGSERLAGAALRGAGSNNLTVEIDEYGRAVLQAKSEGAFGPFTLALTNAGGASYESRPFRVVADFSPLQLTLQETPRGWVQKGAPVRLGLASSSQVTSIEYSLDTGESWQALVPAADVAALPAPFNNVFNRTIDISAAGDGAVNLMIRAVNAAGRQAVADCTVLKDTLPPEAALIVPVAEASVNGTIRMGFSVKEAGALGTVAYRRGAANVEVFNAESWENDYACMFHEVLMDSTAMPLFDNMRFVFTDRAGNSSEINEWPFVIDRAMDIPVAQVVLPEDNEVITADFIVSGVMYDDDAIKQIHWKLDDRPEQTIEAENGFSIPVLLSWLTDNDHTVTVAAEDVYGIRSDPVVRKFRVSLSEPEAAITYPLVYTVLRDEIEITGTASDRNGIKELKVSLDNGTTFIPANGAERWNYKFNTKILRDGSHVVFYRVWDKYDIPATYAGILNIDNTPPAITLDSPGDGFVSVGGVPVMGRIMDPNLKSTTLEFKSLDGSAVNQDLRRRELEVDWMLKDELDLSGMADGMYNLAIVAVDNAGNISRLARNIELARETHKNRVDIYYPLENENMQGAFNLYGFAGGIDSPERVTVRVNGEDCIINEVDAAGFFRVPMDSEFLSDGPNRIEVHSNFGGNTRVTSRAYNINYRAAGPWVTIDSFGFGDFAFDRPYLSGRYGYELTEEEFEILAAAKNKGTETDKEALAAIKAKAHDYTELSFDNGKTFVKASRAPFDKEIDYRYRLETGEMPEGLHYITVRSTMKNGDIAVTRMLVQVDKTFPVIRLISPEVGFHYNQEIAYSASASDDVELAEMTYHLRKGDKALYGVPGFLQGLYFEGIIPPFIKQAVNNAPTLFAGGATYTDFGMGVSFFDDNVKIQIQYGFMTQKLYESLGKDELLRYGGNVLGIKLLASVYTLYFGPIIGPDWEWLSASFALGANFSLFNVGNKENPEYSPNPMGEKVYYTQSGAATWMSALLMQIEFPKVTIPKRKNFRKFSLFTEGQLWFVPTDVDAEANNIPVVIPHVILGLRLYIF